MSAAVRSPKLCPGDRVRLVSPASFPSREYLTESVDEAGAYRIVDGIDFEAVRADPKPLVGLSDITTLHLALWRHCRLATVHGWLSGARAQEAVRRLLMTAEPRMLERDPDALSAAVSVPGCASGPLVGGNLSAVTGLVGAGLPDLDGAILFLEDFRSVGLGRVDRQLTQLIRSGSLEGVQGVALGLFSGFEDYTDRGWSVLDVIRDRLEPLGAPILGGLELGHPTVTPTASPTRSP